MQHFKFLPIIITTLVCASVTLVHADDSAAQAAARAALMEKMNEMSGQQAQTNLPPQSQPEQPAAAQTPPSANPPPMTETPPATPPVATPPVVTTPPPAASGTNQAVARAALMQKMNEMSEPSNAPAGTMQPVVVSPPLTAPPMTNVLTQYPVNPAGAPATTNNAPLVVPPVEQAAPGPQPPPSLAQTPSPAKSGVTNASSKMPAPVQVETQLTAPPLPISAEKQAELQQLLSRYVNNEVTSVQYQEERAKILAQPN